MQWWEDLKNFFKDSYYEMQKVSWPTKDEAVSATKAVILLSVFLAIYLGSIDALVRYLMNLLVK